MIKRGDRVTFIKNGEIKTGTVLKIYRFDEPVAIVDFNGNIEKVLLKYLAKAPKVNQENKKDKPREITISEDEFTKKMSTAVTSKLHELDGLDPNGVVFKTLMLFGAGISGNIHKALFYEAEND